MKILAAEELSEQQWETIQEYRNCGKAKLLNSFDGALPRFVDVAFDKPLDTTYERSSRGFVAQSSRK